jgi:hypothetical protein
MITSIIFLVYLQLRRLLSFRFRWTGWFCCCRRPQRRRRGRRCLDGDPSRRVGVDLIPNDGDHGKEQAQGDDLLGGHFHVGAVGDLGVVHHLARQLGDQEDQHCVVHQDPGQDLGTEDAHDVGEFISVDRARPIGIRCLEELITRFPGGGLPKCLNVVVD